MRMTPVNSSNIYSIGYDVLILVLPMHTLMCLKQFIEDLCLLPLTVLTSHEMLKASMHIVKSTNQ